MFTGYMDVAMMAHLNVVRILGRESAAMEYCATLLGKYGFDPRCGDWYATGKIWSLELKAVHIHPMCSGS
jgi:hypothetical protein